MSSGYFNQPECPCKYRGPPLGKPFQVSTIEHSLNADTYGMTRNLFVNPDGIRNVAPYPYRGITGSAMQDVFDGLPYCRSWAIGPDGIIPRTTGARYTANGIVGTDTITI